MATAFKLLGKQTIPSIIKDSSAEFAELMEVDENLKRNELNHIEVAEHIVRREELMDSLGLTYQQGDNAHTRSDEKLTVQDLADGIGLSKRSYQQRKQLCRINEEVRSMLTETPYAENLVDLIKLSSLSDEMQLDVCNLLITGECRSWASAFYKSFSTRTSNSPQNRGWTSTSKNGGDYPQSIMKFNRVHDDLRNTCNLVNNDDELRVQKSSVNFGRTKIKLHQMNPEQAPCLLWITTPEKVILLPICSTVEVLLQSLHYTFKDGSLDLRSIPLLTKKPLRFYPTMLMLIRINGICTRDVDVR